MPLEEGDDFVRSYLDLSKKGFKARLTTRRDSPGEVNVEILGSNGVFLPPNPLQLVEVEVSREAKLAKVQLVARSGERWISWRGFSLNYLSVSLAKVGFC